MKNKFHKELLFEAVKDSLLDHMGEFLDSELVQYEEACNGVKNNDIDDELHVKMAEAAAAVYMEVVVNRVTMDEQ